MARPPEEVGGVWPATHRAPQTGAGVTWNLEPTRPEGRGRGRGTHEVGGALERFRLAGPPASRVEGRVGRGAVPSHRGHGVEVGVRVQRRSWSWGSWTADRSWGPQARLPHCPGHLAAPLSPKCAQRPPESRQEGGGFSAQLGGRAEEGGGDPPILGSLGNGSSPSPISTPLRKGWWLFRPE